jgi:hypothetical protein
MTCAGYLEISAERTDSSAAVPLLYYLPGLTCTDENVCQKASPFRKLAVLKVRDRFKLSIVE